MVCASPHETEKNRRLRNGNRPERSKFAAFHTPVLTPDVIAREIDMFPAERREVLKRSRDAQWRWPRSSGAPVLLIQHEEIEGSSVRRRRLATRRAPCCAARGHSRSQDHSRLVPQDRTPVVAASQERREACRLLPESSRPPAQGGAN
jgi:hypothetical protein